MSQLEPRRFPEQERQRLAAPGFWARLRVYLVGVGIGLMLLGGFWAMKRNAQKQQQQQGVGGGAGQALPGR